MCIRFEEVAVMKKLTNEQKDQLHKWVYKAEDNSLLSPVMAEFWLMLVNAVPLWVTPATISTLAMISNLVPSILMLYYSPDARQDIPPWLCVAAAIGLFIYQTLDSLDGQQCQRSGRDTPLEEMFDYAVDAATSGLVLLSICIAFKLGEVVDMMFLLVVLVEAVIYFHQWETYNTGVFVFGKIDVIESQFAAMAVFVGSAIYGQDIWKTILLNINGNDVDLRYTLIMVALVVCVCKLCSSIKIIYRYANGTSKKGNHNGMDSIRPVVPLLWAISLTVLAYTGLPVVRGRYACYFMLCLNMMVARFVCALLMSHLTGSVASLYFKNMPVFMAYLMMQLSGVVGSTEAIVFLLFFTVADYVKFFYFMSREICQCFHIECYKMGRALKLPLNIENGVEFHLTDDQKLIETRSTSENNLRQRCVKTD